MFVLFSGCPEGVPMMTCDGDPCSEASCPSHPSASCVANYCGGCRAEWFNGGSPVQCNADQTGSVCNKRVNDTPNGVCVCVGVGGCACALMCGCGCGCVCVWVCGCVR